MTSKQSGVVRINTVLKQKISFDIDKPRLFQKGKIIGYEGNKPLSSIDFYVTEIEISKPYISSIKIKAFESEYFRGEERLIICNQKWVLENPIIVIKLSENGVTSYEIKFLNEFLKESIVLPGIPEEPLKLPPSRPLRPSFSPSEPLKLPPSGSLRPGPLQPVRLNLPSISNPKPSPLQLNIPKRVYHPATFIISTSEDEKDNQEINLKYWIEKSKIGETIYHFEPDFRNKVVEFQIWKNFSGNFIGDALGRDAHFDVYQLKDENGEANMLVTSIAFNQRERELGDLPEYPKIYLELDDGYKYQLIYGEQLVKLTETGSNPYTLSAIEKLNYPEDNQYRFHDYSQDIGFNAGLDRKTKKLYFLSDEDAEIGLPYQFYTFNILDSNVKWQEYSF